MSSDGQTAVSLREFSKRIASFLGSTPDAMYERQRSLVRAGLLKLEGRGRGGGTKATPKNVALLLIAMMASDSPVDAGTRAKKIALTKPDGGTDPFGGGTTFVDTLTKIIDEGLSDHAGYPALLTVSHDTVHAVVEWPTTRARQPTVPVVYSSDRSHLPTGIQKQAVVGGGILLALNRELWKAQRRLDR